MTNALAVYIFLKGQLSFLAVYAVDHHISMLDTSRTL